MRMSDWSSVVCSSDLVEYGAADLGIVGKDVLMENGSSELYEPLDLDIAKCRLSVAAKKDAPARDPRRRLRVATKYPEIARRHFADKGEQVELRPDERRVGNECVRRGRSRWSP